MSWFQIILIVIFSLSMVARLICIGRGKYNIEVTPGGSFVGALISGFFLAGVILGW